MFCTASQAAAFSILPNMFGALSLGASRYNAHSLSRSARLSGELSLYLADAFRCLNPGLTTALALLYISGTPHGFCRRERLFGAALWTGAASTRNSWRCCLSGVRKLHMAPCSDRLWMRRAPLIPTGTPGATTSLDGWAVAAETSERELKLRKRTKSGRQKKPAQQVSRAANDSATGSLARLDLMLLELSSPAHLYKGT
jgi:hypothetical protein